MTRTWAAAEAQAGEKIRFLGGFCSVHESKGPQQERRDMLSGRYRGRLRIPSLLPLSSFHPSISSLHFSVTFCTLLPLLFLHTSPCATLSITLSPASYQLCKQTPTVSCYPKELCFCTPLQMSVYFQACATVGQKLFSTKLN